MGLKDRLITALGGYTEEQFEATYLHSRAAEIEADECRRECAAIHKAHEAVLNWFNKPKLCVMTKGKTLAIATSIALDLERTSPNALEYTKAQLLNDLGRNIAASPAVHLDVERVLSQPYGMSTLMLKAYVTLEVPDSVVSMK